jgi:hypothetical protein
MSYERVVDIRICENLLMNPKEKIRACGISALRELGTTEAVERLFVHLEVETCPKLKGEINYIAACIAILIS